MKLLRLTLAAAVINVILTASMSKAESMAAWTGPLDTGARVALIAIDHKNQDIYHEVYAMANGSEAIGEIVIVISKEQNIGVTARRLQGLFPNIKITTIVSTN